MCDKVVKPASSFFLRPSIDKNSNYPENGGWNMWQRASYVFSSPQTPRNEYPTAKLQLSKHQNLITFSVAQPRNADPFIDSSTD